MGFSGGLSHTQPWRKNEGASLAFAAACSVGVECLLVAGAAAATGTLSCPSPCPNSDKEMGERSKGGWSKQGKGMGGGRERISRVKGEVNEA